MSVQTDILQPITPKFRQLISKGELLNFIYYFKQKKTAHCILENFLMKKDILILLFCFFSIEFLQAQTFVSGGIYNNTTWTLSNSPYVLTGSMVVFPGKTLTIEPGVEVLVKYAGIPNTGLMHYLEVRGSLNAVGTVNQPIVFKSDTLPTEYTWLGINVKATQGGQINIDYVEFSNSFYGIYADDQNASLLNLHHCKFTYNNYAIQPFGPINFYDCSFQYNGQGIASNWQIYHQINLLRCEFINNYSCNGFQNYMNVDSCLIRGNVNGIWYTGGSITNTEFDQNALAIYAVTSNISNCSFNQNYKGLIEFQGTANNCSFNNNGTAAEVAAGGVVTNSTFYEDTIAISYASTLNASSVIPTVVDNRICESVNYYVENKSDLNFQLDQNCFCETDSSVIESLIYDGYDDITKGLFNYTVYDSTCVNVIRMVTKVQLVTSQESNLRNELAVYPIPAGNQVFLKVPENLINKSINAALFDAMGRQKSETRVIDETNLTWDLTNVPQGLYLIKISDEYATTIKFIK